MSIIIIIGMASIIITFIFFIANLSYCFFFTIIKLLSFFCSLTIVSILGLFVMANLVVFEPYK